MAQSGPMESHFLLRFLLQIPAVEAAQAQSRHLSERRASSTAVAIPYRYNFITRYFNNR